MTATGVALYGFSGAQVRLMQLPGRTPFVRKIAQATEGNARLREQAKKQDRLRPILTSAGVSVPRVIAEGDDEGLYFFDMEYVRGLDGVSFLRAASFDDVHRLTRTLIACLETCAPVSSTAARTSIGAEIVKKCAEVQARSALAPADVAENLRRLAAVASQVGDALPPSEHHGDFTLENLIVAASGEIFLVDFLDSYVPHWISDVAKLAQDLVGGWYQLRHQPIPLSVIHHLRIHVEKYARVSYGPSFARIYPLLTAMNFARIVPYVRDASSLDFVAERLSALTARAERALTAPHLEEA